MRGSNIVEGIGPTRRRETCNLHTIYKYSINQISRIRSDNERLVCEACNPHGARRRDRAALTCRSRDGVIIHSESHCYRMVGLHIRKRIRIHRAAMPIAVHHHIGYMVAPIRGEDKGGVVSPCHKHLRKLAAVRSHSTVLASCDIYGVLYLSKCHRKRVVCQHVRKRVAERGLVGSLRQRHAIEQYRLNVMPLCGSYRQEVVVAISHRRARRNCTAVVGRHRHRMLQAQRIGTNDNVIDKHTNIHPFRTIVNDHVLRIGGQIHGESLPNIRLCIDNASTPSEIGRRAVTVGRSIADAEGLKLIVILGRTISESYSH